MAIMINFAEKYANLINAGVPARQAKSYPDDHPLPERYRRQFIHPENGFVKLYCEEYDESKKGTPQEQ